MSETKRGRTVAKAAAVVVLVVVVFLMPNILSGNKYWLTILTLLAINVLLVSSLRSVILINEISLGHVGFALIGAYAQALLMMKGGLTFWPSLILSGLLAAAVASLLGHPFLKVRGIYFSILTLLTAETFRLVVYYWTGLTGGSLGLVGVPSPEPVTLFGRTVEFNTVNTYYYLAVGVVVIALLILYHFERAYINFQWRAIRDDSMLAGALGINVVGFKMVNFTISAFMAGISGGLFAAFQHNLSPDTTSRFGVTMSIYLLVYMVVGGQTRFIGPLIGTAVLTLVAEATRSIAEYQPMVTGSIAILVMIFLPMGLAGIPAQIQTWLRKRRLRSAEAPVGGGTER
ncbi:MAG: branched-chain amino acid ABC transporter permease [Actinomycetia bacterium]|nr:branched-chain amino acid ABC transporter permease [Actinomycetes bacterium]